jgi:hypothetical protein
VNLTE